MRTPIAPLSVRWPLSSLAETDASDHASAACYRRPEHIGIDAVVVAELKFRDVERHIFGADILWNVPTTPRLKIDQKPSIVFVWTAPTTYCLRWWSTVWCGYCDAESS